MLTATLQSCIKILHLFIQVVFHRHETKLFVAEDFEPETTGTATFVGPRYYISNPYSDTIEDYQPGFFDRQFRSFPRNSVSSFAAYNQDRDQVTLETDSESVPGTL